MTEIKQRYADAVNRLVLALNDAEVIREIVSGYIQEYAQPIKEKQEELELLRCKCEAKQTQLTALEKEIREKSEWTESKEDFVIRQLHQALDRIAERSQHYKLINHSHVKSAVQTEVSRRINVLLEISRLQLSNKKIDELAKVVREHRSNLAKELQSGRLRLRQLEDQVQTLERRRNHFSETVNKVCKSNGFAPVPSPKIDASQITRTTTPLPNKPGIYFLWEGSAIAYVGQSINLSARVGVNHHQLQRTDKISYLCIENDNLFYHESFYIGVCRPWRNGRGYGINGNRERNLTNAN